MKTDQSCKSLFLSYVNEIRLFIPSLDRLARNSKDTKDLLQLFRSKGASIEILDLPSFNGVTDPALRDLLTNLVIEVFSDVAEKRTEKNQRASKKKALKLQRKMVVILVKRFNTMPMQQEKTN